LSVHEIGEHYSRIPMAASTMSWL